MRTHGTLKTWNDDRGFGFIAPAPGGDDLFVHVSAFPSDGMRPRINEVISYEVDTGPDGKRRAVRVMRPGQRPPPRPARAQDRPRRASWGVREVVTVLAIAAIAAVGYSRFTAPSDLPASTPTLGVATASRAAPGFKCDGRTHCSQMTSCAEARYFIEHCPNTKMDGDGDRVPCEAQWCN